MNKLSIAENMQGISRNISKILAGSLNIWVSDKRKDIIVQILLSNTWKYLSIDQFFSMWKELIIFLIAK